MELRILSFDALELQSHAPFPEHTTLISIGDPDALPPRLVHRPAHVLRLIFDDITPEEAADRLELPDIAQLPEAFIDALLQQYHTRIFTDAMAERAAAFIMRFAGETELFICQCEHGQSRSAAFAAAIRDGIAPDAPDIFADARYSPNRWVYDKLCNALRKEKNGACKRTILGCSGGNL